MLITFFLPVFQSAEWM